MKKTVTVRGRQYWRAAREFPEELQQSVCTKRTATIVISDWLANCRTEQWTPFEAAIALRAALAKEGYIVVANQQESLSKGLSEDARIALTQLRQKTVLSGCTSYIQRKMNIGYLTAARIMDELESAEEISPEDDDGKRHWPAGRAALGE